ncbi:acetate--CoA ligase [Luminiphilus syltensis NOR5-1B]|uniref:Acetyl-coenzyme A synthetase n=1 Tax=Luminiphilus syltensis NOR5-1B TaxID=565045 RepID=B8KVA9_9GAMM|nr:acetate--CoA ligase [Luminiphilus syltensis]EED36357.1 acetate--CoA ligase [Luminiphilus syltensis NOR5-1B]
MPEANVVPIPANFADAHIKPDDYTAMYRRSIEDRDGFFAEMADQFLTWDKRWDSVSAHDFVTGEATWFDGGKLNVSVNCIDRHLPERADQVAIIWEGDDPSVSKSITYAELKAEVCKLANALRARGVGKGDRVCLYMPMIPEAAYAMLACARIGAIHSIVFGGFSPEALKDRIQAAECKALITCDEGYRGGKTIPLKHNADISLADCPSVSTCVVVRHTGCDAAMHDDRDVYYHEITAQQSEDCEPESMDSEDPLFILYTSGSTGQPKGVLHTTAGYLLQASITFKYVFDYRDGEVFWCTADVGWVTGHSYIVYGPLANGATTLMFEGVPTYPDAGRFWQVVDKYNVASFYTAPTAIRALQGKGDEFVKQSSRKSLRILGTVGEPINPEAWEWYFNVVGDGRCPIVDTWWQTETGAHMITSLPGAIAMKPGSATLPFFGVELALLEEDGSEIEGEGSGYLVVKSSWPSQIRTVYGDHQRMVDTYFSHYPGYYFTGDGAKRDADGYYWITGRVDDVINVSGHRMGTAEVERALALHESIAEAAVVGFPHDIKGQGIYCYVTPMDGVEGTDALKAELVNICAEEIGHIAKPDVIQWAPGLPKTRSGKIMRRILRKIAENELENLGDTSTLADPAVVEDLIENRAK